MVLHGRFLLLCTVPVEALISAGTMLLMGSADTAAAQCISLLTGDLCYMIAGIM